MRKQVQISINEELLEKIDSYITNNYLSRSSFFTLAASQFLSQVEVTQYMKQLTVIMREIADKGEVTEEMSRQLEDLEKLSKMLLYR